MLMSSVDVVPLRVLGVSTWVGCLRSVVRVSLLGLRPLGVLGVSLECVWVSLECLLECRF